MRVGLFNILGRLSFILGSLCIMAALILMLTNQTIFVSPERNRFAIIIPLIVSALVLFLTCRRILSIAREKDFVTPDDVFFVKPSGIVHLEALDKSAAGIAANFKEEELRTALRLALNLGQFTSRATECIDLGQGTLSRTSDRKIRVSPFPPSSVENLFIPMSRHKKGRLINHISISVDGADVNTLPHDDNVALSIVLVSRLYERAMADWTGSTDSCDAAFAKVRHDIAHSDPQSRHGWLPESLVNLQNLWVATIGHPLPQKQRAFVRFAGYLCDYYIIFCQVPRGSKKYMSLKVETSENRPYRNRGFYNFIRRQAGLPIYRYRIPIPLACEAQTYHLRAAAPDRTYLHAATFRRGTTTSLSGRASTPPRPSKDATVACMIAPTWGSESLHVYTRNLGDFISPYTIDDEVGTTRNRPAGLYVDADFKIIPPAGSLATLLLSTYLAAITTAVALNHDTFFGLGNSSLLTVILGIPALVSAWGISRLSSTELMQTTPLMLTENLATIAVSLLAVGVTIAKYNSQSPEEVAAEQFPGFLGGVIFGHPWWFLVWILSVTHLLVCSASYNSRMRRYAEAQHRATS